MSYFITDPIYVWGPMFALLRPVIGPDTMSATVSNPIPAHPCPVCLDEAPDEKGYIT